MRREVFNLPNLWVFIREKGKEREGLSLYCLYSNYILPDIYLRLQGMAWHGPTTWGGLEFSFLSNRRLWRKCSGIAWLRISSILSVLVCPTIGTMLCTTTRTLVTSSLRPQKNFLSHLSQLSSDSMLSSWRWRWFFVLDLILLLKGARRISEVRWGEVR